MALVDQLFAFSPDGVKPENDTDAPGYSDASAPVAEKVVALAKGESL